LIFPPLAGGDKSCSLSAISFRLSAKEIEKYKVKPTADS
jgi:hypothetical protein